MTCLNLGVFGSRRTKPQRGAGKQAASAERTASLQPVNPSPKKDGSDHLKMNKNKLRRSVLFLALTVTAISVVACSTPTEVKTPPATPAPSPASSASPAASPLGSPVASPGAASKVDSLVGRWPGKEGTYLNISKKGEKYSVEIANLDGPKTFEGTAKGDTIEFTRNGKTEVIKAATGVETGMKDFEKETNCVVVTKGTEGFCKK